MNNERGFVTIFALCLIVVVALVVKGIQETDMNRNYAADKLLAEFNLQSAADGGIYEAAEKVRSGQKDLPANNFPPGRKDYQKKLVSRIVNIPYETPQGTSYKTITVNVWGERLQIQDYVQEKYPKDKNKPKPVGTPHYGYVLFSVAQMDSERFGKMYRRSVAYVIDGKGYDEEQPVDDKDKDVVHFMTLP